MAIDDRSFMYEVEYIDIHGNPTTEENSIHKIPDFLDTKLIDMELPVIENYRIGTAYEFRPDLISLQFYGTHHFGWLIAYHNKFLDPVAEFYAGRLVEIPDINEYFKYFNRFSRDD